jgi:hypothetical protein
MCLRRSYGESGIGRLSAGHSIRHRQMPGRSGIVARSEDGDEMTESRNSRHFCSTFFLTIFLKYRPLPIGYLPIANVRRISIGRYPECISRLHIAHTYCRIVQTSAKYWPMLHGISADYRPMSVKLANLSTARRPVGTRHRPIHGRCLKDVNDESKGCAIGVGDRRRHQ